MINASGLEKYMRKLINKARAEEGLKGVKLERNLNEAAEDHSEDMLDEGYFSHTGDDGSKPAERMDEAGFDLEGSWNTGENLAIGTLDGSASLRDDVDRLFDMLMDSDGHRANILSEDYTHVGIGIEVDAYAPYSGRQTMMVTQNFGRTQGALDEQIFGTAGNNRLNGQDGDDHVSGYAGADVLKGGNGRDKLYGGSGYDKLMGQSANDKLYGQNGNDKVFGGAGSDELRGNSGNDVLKGGAGSDRLFGGNGKDNLVGGAGQDRLIGGGGADTFVFRSGADHDVIADFDPARDSVRLGGALIDGDMSARQVVRGYGSRTEDGIELDFGQDSLTFEGVYNLNAVADSLIF